MLSLVDEAQNTRHALKPIEEYARAGYVGESERQLLLGCIGRLRSLNARLNREMLRQLDNKVKFASELWVAHVDVKIEYQLLLPSDMVVPAESPPRDSS